MRANPAAVFHTKAHSKNREFGINRNFTRILTRNFFRVTASTRKNANANAVFSGVRDLKSHDSWKFGFIGRVTKVEPYVKR